MTPKWQQNGQQLFQGDVLDVLAALPAESVQCVVTSPPYWGLRCYGVDGQIGQEPTPEEYLDKMVAVFREVRRVLRADGVCWVNMGDGYGGGPCGGGSVFDSGRTDGRATYEADKPRGREYMKVRPRPPGLKPKDLIGMPWRLAFALQADGWWLRSEVIWSKSNPMPESVTDRPTKAHEQIFLLTKAARYFYDAEAVREPAEYGRCGWDSQQFKGGDITRHHGGPGNHRRGCDPGAGRNLRSVWTIPTQPYPDAHFATFPEKLPELCIRAGTSAHGCCAACGTPWRRVLEKSDQTRSGPVASGWREVRRADLEAIGRCGEVSSTTTGWAKGCDCKTDARVPCTVLDPFAGSGTTLAVARREGCRAIGIELNAEYCELAVKRISRTDDLLPFSGGSPA
jgi:DNA modification methylase